MSVPAPATAPTRKTQIRRLLIAIAVIIVLIVVGLVVRAATAPKKAAVSAQRQQLIAAAALDACPAASGSGAVKNGLPSLTLPCLGDGPAVDLAKLRGPMVVNVWAGPCQPCQREAPLIQKFYAAAKGKVAVLGVDDGNYPAETWDDGLDASRGLGLHYPSVFDAHGKVADFARAGGIPVSFLIRADGTIAYEAAGELTAGKLPQDVKKYLGITVDVSS